jgi:hypothetical protein
MTVRGIGSILAGAVAVVLLAQSAVLQAQTGATALGTVRLPRAVMADGKALPAGSYSLRVASDAVAPVKGQGAENAKWVEFVQAGQVKGRELASVVGSADVKTVVKGKAPASNTAKVELLKGGEYLRVSANRGGNVYLIHLVVGS